MNEFVVILKIEKLKRKFWKISNSIVIKKTSHSRFNLWLNTPKKQSKRIIEAELIRLLQIKDIWKSEWIRHFN